MPCCTTVCRASTLVWTSQALGRGCCHPCPYRMHSSHWQLLSVKTGSVPSHPLQKALPSPQWHLRVLCCSSERPELTLAVPLGHGSGRSPLQTALILNCAAGSPCLFNFSLLALPALGPTTPSSPAAMQKGSSVWLHSAMCERKAIKEHCPSNYNTAFYISSPFSTGLFFYSDLRKLSRLFQMKYLHCT